MPPAYLRAPNPGKLAVPPPSRCGGAYAYSSRGEARAAIRHPGLRVAYHCTGCGRWHVGGESRQPLERRTEG